jgi:hypothetical protein
LKNYAIKYTTIAYTDTGKGTNRFVARFRKKNVGQVHCNFAKTAITIDLLGHGETECLGYVHSMEDNAEAVQAVYLITHS